MIILGSLICFALIAFQFTVIKSTNSTKRYNYDVEKEIGEVEIRNYPNAIFAKIDLSEESYNKMANKGFRVLASYIFGGNSEEKSIAMTSPVIMEMNETHSMEFMMPTEYSIESLPIPKNTEIKIINKESWKAASIKFGGYANDEKIEEHIIKLKSILAQNNIKHKNNFKFFGYNPPYQLVGRRNEVVVELYL